MKFRHKNNLPGKYFFIVFLFTGSIILVFLSWILELISRDMIFSWQSVITIHRTFSIWLIDLFPLVILAILILYTRRIRFLQDEMERYRKEQEQRLNKYTLFAENLGMGNYETDLEIRDESDTLGNSLKYLQGYLKATWRKERQSRWVLEGKEVISKTLRLYTTLDELSWNVLKILCDLVRLEQGALYHYNKEEKLLKCIAAYAHNRQKQLDTSFPLGYGLVGQCALDMDFIYRTEIPEDYTTIRSGILGEQIPKSLVIVPLISEDTLHGVMEFASIQPKIPKNSIQFLLEMGEIIARTLNNLEINHRTAELLEESRKMTFELQLNQQKLQENAVSMNKTQEALETSNRELAKKIIEAENAQSRLHWLLENASELITVYDANLELSYVSPSVINILGFTEEEFTIGKGLEGMTPEGKKSFSSLLENAINFPGNKRAIQYSFRKKNGETIFLESSAKNLLHDKAVVGIIVNSRDITESIRASREEMLKTQMQALSENSMDMIIRLSLKGQFHYVNPVVEDYTGMTPESIIGKNLSELAFMTELKDYFMRSLGLVKLKPVKIREEVNLPVRLGEKITERVILFDAIPEFLQTELETLLVVGHDITEAKRIEKELKEKNRNIHDSINYSRKIQSAILPYPDTIREAFPGSFTLFRPRDVISGDFPWYYRDNESTYLAAVDCTGHGVPGSMLSFIAYFLLNDVVKNDGTLTAGEICDLLDEEFRKTLKQDNVNSASRDGLDIALCKFTKTMDRLDFAGAHRPLYLLRQKELYEFKGNRKSIGGAGLFKKIDEKFINHSIDLVKGDKLFFFTDGLTDQLGGPYGRKYTQERVKSLIMNNQKYTMEKFKELFEEDFSIWMKGFRQLDDVLMIGLEF